MINYPRWAILVTLVVCLWGVIFAAPNFFDEPPAVLPGPTVPIGLDLQGGGHWLLDVDVDKPIIESLESIRSQVRSELRSGQPKIDYSGLAVDGNAVEFALRSISDHEAARERVRDIDPGIVLKVTDGINFRLEFTEEALRERTQRLVETSMEVLRQRVDEAGVLQPTIQQQGRERILLQVPGVEDPEGFKTVFELTGSLTFQLIDEQASVADAIARGRALGDSRILFEDDSGRQIPYVVFNEIVVSGEHLVDAQPVFQEGRWVVSFRFDAQGAQDFGRVTAENVGRRFAAVLDDKIISAPVIQSAILGGSGIITGNFTQQEAAELSLVLRAGALPTPLTVLEERTVGPGIGAESVAAGILASVVGFIAVVAFMISSYGFFGAMASVALVFNLALIIALMSVLGATLTLPGIAGIVLTIGMAVDANVLILERVKEEARNGRSPIAAIEAGYRRALGTIVDSNLTTLIAALLLFNFGTGPIKGFAVTLSMGILISMFTALMLTRLLVVNWLRSKQPSKLPI